MGESRRAWRNSLDFHSDATNLPVWELGVGSWVLEGFERVGAALASAS